jgi:deoxyadenosine/deoxycytidine kinase
MIKSISMAGPIGVGKSTLGAKVAEMLGYKFVQEPLDENEYLEDFYKDPSLAFKTQIAFLAARFAANTKVAKGGGRVDDRDPRQDLVFARMLHESGTMDDRDYRCYRSLYDTLAASLGNDMPDAILWLDADVDVLLQRIQSRGRPCEKEIERDYLVDLQKQYERFAAEMAEHVPVYKINWNEFKPTEDLWYEILRAHDGTPGIKEI